jgi:hypothetical protein
MTDHCLAIEKLLELDSDDEEGWGCGCNERFCYHEVGLCPECGDVEGRKVEPVGCGYCWEIWAERKWEQYEARITAT